MFMFMLHRPVGIVVEDIASGAGGLEFDFRVGRIGHTVTQAAEMGRATCCKLRSNTESIVKI